MRYIIYGLFVGVILWAAVGQVGAQDIAEQYYQEPDGIYSTSIKVVALNTNMCLDELIQANPELFSPEVQAMTYSELVDQIDFDRLYLTGNPQFFIPAHKPCYRMFDASTFPKVVVDAYNVCQEEVITTHKINAKGEAAFLARGFTEEIIYYFRKDAPPCINEQGYRLEYHATFARRLPEPYYKPLRYDVPPADICPADLIEANPALFYPLMGPYVVSWSVSGDERRYFLPADLSHCEPVTFDPPLTLYDVSQTTNICIEDILRVNSLFSANLPDMAENLSSLFLPTDTAPCYSEPGQRIGDLDKAVHTIAPDERLVDIARQYHVCLQDLWDANPTLNFWLGSHHDELQRLGTLFIPDKPCNTPITTLKTQPHHSLFGVSILTNVCISRLIKSNPQYPHLNDLELMQEIGEELTLTIPDRWPCYVQSGLPYFKQWLPVIYICTAIDVTDDMDLTGHVPPITSSFDTTLPFCEPRASYMTVYYENEAYSLYEMTNWDTYITIGQCFGIDPYELLTLNAGQFPEAVRPQGSILLPHPLDLDCPLLTDESEVRSRYYSQTSYRAGYVIDGVYTVNYNDTLSSIGWSLGYPYQWIADANNLTEPYTIYYRQELKLPPYPSLYTLVPIGGAGGVIVLTSTAIYGLRRWLRRRHVGKKKNNDTK